MGMRKWWILSLTRDREGSTTMAQGKKGKIGILTGGGDVPGLNPAIRAITYRAISEGYDVVGFRRGWRGLIDIVRENDADNSRCFLPLT